LREVGGDNKVETVSQPLPMGSRDSDIGEPGYVSRLKHEYEQEYAKSSLRHDRKYGKDFLYGYN
jgi:hypothetical protein